MNLTPKPIHQNYPTKNSFGESLPTKNSSGYVLGRRGLERLDLLLLAIEALDLNGSQSMLWTSNKLGLTEYFPNHVEIWKCRCHNPMRKSSRRGPLNSDCSEALILLTSTMAERLYPSLRMLISSKEPLSIHEQRWNLFNRRIKELIEERMNKRRGAVQKLLYSEMSEPILRQLVFSLALSVGSGGVDRLRSSLLDSTV